MTMIRKLWDRMRGKGMPAPRALPAEPLPAEPLELSGPGPMLALPRPKPTLALALQGGGAHGAFTWGVLDRLLEEDIRLVGVSGASAGAMNATMLVQGWARGGRDGARAELANFWERVSAAGRLGPIRPSVTGRLLGRWNVDHAPGSHLVDWAKRWITPYQTQSADFHPLRGLLAEMVEPELIRRSGLRLFVSATNVRTGALRLFDETEVDVDHLLASACLPNLFRAVRIDGQDYWDGGYLANPPLSPLAEACPGADLMVVAINPFTCATTPEDPAGIAARLNQITFNAALLQEMRCLSACGDAPRLHLIGADEHLQDLGLYSKLMTDWSFLNWLRDAGREAAGRWVAENLGRVGMEGSARSPALA
ncbi:patatin-like phospholipase family protein [Azospirillum sp. Sh1]|uniref:patatin-like phospholipase family protein n=1 Tax=Azospirillum sp. Sh1 TaxID=2607285 RepID=UPI0011EF3E23|nr:patatin-like phospholipase family protein [Azospirillum sp. Sh1]KAA0582554.1 patatin-like phospholipase family protein [Azospirillum sp. Sh1]